MKNTIRVHGEWFLRTPPTYDPSTSHKMRRVASNHVFVQAPWPPVDSWLATSTRRMSHQSNTYGPTIYVLIMRMVHLRMDLLEWSHYYVTLDDEWGKSISIYKKRLKSNRCHPPICSKDLGSSARQCLGHPPICSKHLGSSLRHHLGLGFTRLYALLLLSR